jgi:pimeloyl-ACP methyl ester carboxylesterase
MTTAKDNDAPLVLLVPGLWHGAWAWQKVEHLLDERGIRHRALTFPGRDRQPGDETFAGHCAHFREAVETLDGPLVVVAHSYGGAVVTEAADPARVHAAVFVTAFPLFPDESIADVMDGGDLDDEAVAADSIHSDDGYLRVDRATALEGFYQDCDPAEAEAAFERLTPEHPSTRSAKVTTASWQQIPSGYIVCADDQAVPVDVQRTLAARVQSSIEIASGHSPMLSRPGELIDMIEKVVQDLATRA